MQLQWVISGDASDRIDVADAEEAHTVLCRAVKAEYERLGSDALASALAPVYGLRMAMVTDGRMAVERGDQWSTGVGGILVRLLP